MSLRKILYTKTKTDRLLGNSKRAAYSDEEVLHAFQWVVERCQDFGVLDWAVWSVSQLSVALEH